MTMSGSVDGDGFALEWVRDGSGVPMLIVGPPRYYQRVNVHLVVRPFRAENGVGAVRNAVSLWFFEVVSESGGSCVVGPSLSPRSREHED